MRPGKPVFFGSLKGTPFLGLPGNPVSTGVCAIVFLKKIIQKFLGQKLNDDIVYIKLNRDLDKNDHRKDYIRSKISYHLDGEFRVEPFSKQDSGQISIFSKSDGFIIREPYQEKLKKGSKVPVLRPPYNI
jgi:molybdopterin molybdotransferase